MKKPTKEKKAEYNFTHNKKHREAINKRRRKENPEKNNSIEIKSAKENQDKNKNIFDKSYYGKRLRRLIKK